LIDQHIEDTQSKHNHWFEAQKNKSPGRGSCDSLFDHAVHDLSASRHVHNEYRLLRNVLFRGASYSACRGYFQILTLAAKRMQGSTTILIERYRGCSVLAGLRATVMVNVTKSTRKALNSNGNLTAIADTYTH
jgi:hypothetical protein